MHNCKSMSSLAHINSRRLSLVNKCVRCNIINERCSRYYNSLPASKMKLPERYFITTPIYYVNSVPHIGHLYSNALADAVSRWYVMCGASVTFSTGTDEHGLKIQQAAGAQGIETDKFCDAMSLQFQRLFKQASIDYTDFIRTTEPRHKQAVEEVWNTLYRRGYIYKGLYEGWYSVSDETFLTNDEVFEITDQHGKKGMISKESGRPVEWMKEENYKFRLSEMSTALTQWLDSGKVIHPDRFEPMVRRWIEAGLPDLSVSRARSRIPWGIPVPNDDTHTIYVWLDALVNYLTIGGYPTTNLKQFKWPVDCHVVGKDILRFHAVYWPAFLLAAGLDPPRQILCHSHWLYGKEKMSKSRGNVVDPFDRLARYSPDGLRYYLLKDGVAHHDGHFTDERAVECINSDLVNTFGNLLSRTTSLSLNKAQIFPHFHPEIFHKHASESDKDMLAQLRLLTATVDIHYRSFDTHRALDAIMTQLYKTNAYVQEQKPWELAKQRVSSATTGYHSDAEALLDNVLHVAMETVRVAALLLQPVVPSLSDRALTRLNVPTNHRTLSHINKEPGKYSGRSLGPDTGPLLPRIKLDS